MTTARVLTDPQVRLGAGTAALLVMALASARPRRVGEATAAGPVRTIFPVDAMPTARMTLAATA
jgi:hypothetical protein